MYSTTKLDLILEVKFYRIIFFLLFSSLTSSNYILAQKWSYITSHELKDPVVAYSLDRYGNTFYASALGVVFKFDPDGKILQNYSPDTPTEIDLLEAWYTISIFSFSKEFQSYTVLDRRLGLSGSFSLDDQTDFISMATPSSDGFVWLFDQDGFSIKKVNILNQDILIHFPLDLILKDEDFDISFMKEYQNKLLIYDKNSGLLVFDIMGDYLKKIELKGLDWFGTYKNEIYFLDGNQNLKFLDIYTENQRVMILPKHEDLMAGLINKDRLILFTKDQIIFYKAD